MAFSRFRKWVNTSVERPGIAFSIKAFGTIVTAPRSPAAVFGSRCTALFSSAQCIGNRAGPALAANAPSHISFSAFETPRLMSRSCRTGPTVCMTFSTVKGGFGLVAFESATRTCAISPGAAVGVSAIIDWVTSYAAWDVVTHGMKIARLHIQRDDFTNGDCPV